MTPLADEDARPVRRRDAPRAPWRALGALLLVAVAHLPGLVHVESVARAGAASMAALRRSTFAASGGKPVPLDVLVRVDP